MTDKKDGPQARPASARMPAAWSLIPLAVAAITFLAFLPTLRSEFVKLDDDFNYLNNPNYRGLGLKQLHWMFFTFQLGGVYQPLSWLTNAVDYKLWGMNPLGYHLGNLLIHCAGAVMLYFLAVELLRVLAGSSGEEPDLPLRLCAAFGTLFFSVHPQRVACVAWASNRSYVLPAFFHITALWAYLKANSPARKAGAGTGTWRALSVLSFALSLLSKAIGVTLPAVLLILDVYPLRRLGEKKGWLGEETWPVWLEKVPYGLLALAGVYSGAKGRYTFGAIVPVSKFGWGSRIAEAMYGAIFYLEKTVAPFHLAALYTLPSQLRPLDMLCLGRTLAFAALCAAALWAWWRRRPALSALWAAHLVTLSPFLGLSQYGLMLEIAADKWYHLAAIGWSLAAGAALHAGWRAFREGALEASRFRRLAAAACLVVAALSVLTWRQTRTWHDTETLFNHNIRVEPDCYFCHNNLAVAFNDQKRHPEAIAHALESLRIKPDYSLAHINLGVGYVAMGRVQEALAAGDRALHECPGNAQIHFNQGWYLSLAGRTDEAIEETRAAVRLDGSLAAAHYNLGFFMQSKNQLDEAEKEYQASLRLNPDAANAHYNYGIILTSQGRYAEAAVHCARAHELNPTHDSPLCRRTP